jgi:hypothetical protein
MMANGIDDSGFPVMYIDPVYATVTSKTSNVDFEYVNEEWRESIGLSGGIIQFLSQGNIPKKVRIINSIKSKVCLITDRGHCGRDCNIHDRKTTVINTICHHIGHFVFKSFLIEICKTKQYSCTSDTSVK